jgi:hypothetical protein
MNKTSIKKILDHHDKDEIISKLIIGISPKDIHDWLKAKYTNVSEAKFVLSEKLVKSFQDNYLDIYTMLKEDIAKTKIALSNNTEENLQLAVKDNSAYKNAMLEMATNEIDAKRMITNLCVAIETRLSQVFDAIQQDPNNINTRIDRLMIEYADTLGNVLEKYYKFVEQAPDQIIQHNITLQAVDQHISVFHEVIREVLSQMDLESAMYFMEVFNDKMSKLKPSGENNNVSSLTSEAKLAEVKILNEEINKKINENDKI